MSRNKKTRKAGENGPKTQVKSRSTQESRTLAPKKQASGNKAGSRHNQDNSHAGASGVNQGTHLDKRHGSKKPITLDLLTKSSLSPVKEKSSLTPEQRLLQLENDPKLNQLLDNLEEGRSLTELEQKWLNQQLEAIEALMAQLNIVDEPEVNPEPLRATGDDALLDQFSSGADFLELYQNDSKQ